MSRSTLALATATLAATASAAFNAAVKTNVVVYWGQGSNVDLSTVCKDPSIDVVNLAFVNGFPKEIGDYPKSNFANSCESYFDDPKKPGEKSGLLYCPDLTAGINECRKNSKKVLLSLGGGYPLNYYLPNKNVAEWFAGWMLEAFGPKKSGSTSNVPRPFGDAYVDGFDLDLEADPSQVPAGGISSFYSDFVNRVKTLQPNTLITAAPQCESPDIRLKDAIANSRFDMIFTQFYNTNACSARVGYNELNKATDAQGQAFTFDAWLKWLAANSKNRDVKLYLGLGAGVDGIGASKDHYLKPEEANALITKWQRTGNFGGVMLWSHTVSNNNVVNCQSYHYWVKSALTGNFKNAFKSCTSSSARPSSSTIAPSSSSVVRSSSIVSTTSAAVTPTATVVSPNGYCGDQKNGLAYTCKGYNGGECCSEYGYCGGLEGGDFPRSAYCGTGCNKLFGDCDGLSSSIASSTRASSSAVVSSSAVISSSAMPSSSPVSSSVVVSSSAIQSSSAQVSSSAVQSSSAQISSSAVQSSSAQISSSAIQSSSAQVSSSAVQSSSAQISSSAVHSSSAQVSSSAIQSSSAEISSSAVQSSSAQASSSAVQSSSAQISSSAMVSSSASVAQSSVSASEAVSSSAPVSSSAGPSSSVPSSSGSVVVPSSSASSSDSVVPSSSVPTGSSSVSPTIVYPAHTTSHMPYPTGGSSGYPSFSSAPYPYYNVSSSPIPGYGDSTPAGPSSTPCTTSTKPVAPSSTPVVPSSKPGYGDSTPAGPSSTPCTTSTKPVAPSSKLGYPEYSPSSKPSYPEYSPSSQPGYPAHSASSTTKIITTTYVDSCSTGLTTKTETITKTICNKCTKPEEDSVTSVYVCKNCGPSVVTVTITKPNVPATNVPAKPTGPVYGNDKPNPPVYNNDKPHQPVYSADIKKQNDATSTTVQIVYVTKTPVPVVPVVPAHTPIVYPSGPAKNATSGYPTKPTGTGVPTKPTYAPPQFTGAASRVGAGLTGVVALAAGLLIL